MNDPAATPPVPGGTDESGLVAPHGGQDQDWAALARHLDDHGFDFDREENPPRQFSKGYGNLNYLVHVNGTAMVLRRPPLGPIPPGANDMGRESRILSRLWHAFPLAPRCHHFCADESVLGAPFFLMDYRPGLVIGAESPAHLTPEDKAGIGQSLIRVLVALHAVDPASVALETLGRPEGFLERTVAGWRKRAGLSWEENPPPLLAELGDWLDRNQPASGTVTLLHNDYKLDNMILSPETLEPAALLDWDMGTRGDPLLDLAVSLSYWTEAGDPDVMHRLRQMPTAEQGYPTRADAVDGYAAWSGRDLSDFLFYRVLGQFRLAVVFAQLHRRWRAGGTQDPAFEAFGQLADDLLEYTKAIQGGEIF